MPVNHRAARIVVRLSTAVVAALISWSRIEVATASPQEAVTPPAAEASAVLIEISDEPRSLDPATLMDPKLAAPMTVEFNAASMKELYRWLQDEQKLSLSIDAAAMKEKGILSSELVTEKLNNEPLYLLLDRLKSLGIGWHSEGGDLFLTTTDAANHQMSTVSYNLGELLDSGFVGERILEAITSATGSTSIEDGDEEGAVVLLGDVVFARQTQYVQREIRGLLAALKKSGRRTLIMDPPQHAALREKMLQRISLTLEEVPLSEAIQQIANVAGADIRINAAELKKAGVRDRAPISIDMADQKLILVLQSALSELKLTPLIQDGVIWVVQKKTAEAATRTAVFDVRDLCRDDAESEALSYALTEQAGGMWENDGDQGGALIFARPGIMVVRHTEQMLDSVSQLLENYRTALRESKPRKSTGPDPKELVTYYYRLPTEMAKDLQVNLKDLVRPETWKSDQQPQASGTILLIKSTADLLDAQGRTAVGSAVPTGHVLVVDNSVLIIHQMREVHTQLDDLINKLTRGERLWIQTRKMALAAVVALAVGSLT